MATQSICEAALEEYEEKLSGLPNVTGLGIVSLDEKNPASPDLAIAVYVEKKVPADELDKLELVPKKIQIKQGEVLQEVFTRVIEQGVVSLEADDNDSDFSIESL